MVPLSPFFLLLYLALGLSLFVFQGLCLGIYFSCSYCLVLFFSYVDELAAGLNPALFLNLFSLWGHNLLLDKAVI